MRVLAVTLFLSAFLLFMCQPMVGKMLLPYLGGAAAVWTTCVLFFQFMLLLGYIYAHLVARIDDVRKQILIHGVVLLLPLAFLPIRFGASSEGFALHPLLNLLGVLAASTAVPFFVVSTTAPLLQNWFSRTAHAASSDPYFLYSASNAGSLLALLAYPFFIEPRIGVTAQSRIWSGGYLALLAMFAITVLVLSRGRWQRLERAASSEVRDAAYWKSRLYWIAASFVPSALMLAVTNHVSANVGSVPFLWVIPLALYLVTFILAFARSARSTQSMSIAVPVVMLGLFPLVVAGVIIPPRAIWIVIAAHLILLFVCALLCHNRLAASRPRAEHLTEFYFWVALGGVLGGIFTAIVSPALFNTVLEYPLLAAAVPFFRTSGEIKKRDLLLAAAVGAGLLIIAAVFSATKLDAKSEAVALVHTLVLYAGYKISRNPSRFAWTLAAVMLAYGIILPRYIEDARPVYGDRNFFGVKKVMDDPSTRLRKLFHGDTVHGIESTDPARAGQPLSYYYPGGSVSDAIETLRLRGSTQRVAVLGLGAGVMGAFADPTHHVRFYEIDPSVEEIARRYFTFLDRCAANCDVVIGDGRLEIAREPDAGFDLLVLDAFSSDSIPTHLVSREAVGMYLAKLKPDGLLLFNVSNRYLDVAKLVSALVADAGLVGYSRFDDAGELQQLGKSSANHVIAARKLEHLGGIPQRPGWTALTPPENFTAWTDDYSNLLSLIRFH